MKKIGWTLEEKMFSRMETAVGFVNQEYMKDFTLTKENCTADLQTIMDFLNAYCKDHAIVFVHERRKEKAHINTTMNCSDDFLIVSYFMTCIIPNLETETAIPKPT